MLLHDYQATRVFQVYLGIAAIKVDVYAQAMQGLLSLESSWEKQSKYFDFIDNLRQT